jgi:TRAP-type C4-dicarboxylate transport system permease small subunit
MGNTPKVLLWADKQLGRLAGLFAVAGGLAVVGLMGITVVAVVWRYLLNNPIFGIEDISIITLTIVAGASVAYGSRYNAHVSVDVISFVFGRNVKRFTDLAMRIAVVFISGLATYALFAKACGVEKACITGNMSIEHRMFYYFLGICMGFYVLHVLVQLLTGLYHFLDEDPNEVLD